MPLLQFACSGLVATATRFDESRLHVNTGTMVFRDITPLSTTSRASDEIESRRALT